MFLKEVSRMYPVASRYLIVFKQLIINIINFIHFFKFSVSNRRCTNHTTIKGIDIPVDTIIAPDVMTLHYDPEHWGEVDPNVFYPLRFSADYERNKAAYMPFGYGPMSCVGNSIFIY